MKSFLHEQTFLVEEEHWWFVGMRYIFASLIKDYYFHDIKILDAGAGTGINKKYLGKWGEVTGIEKSELAISLAAKRGVDLMQGNINHLPFADNTFDLITCFDVLYHKEVKPEQAASELLRVLKPGGILFARDGAYDWLYSNHDDYVQTGRRFTRKSHNALFPHSETIMSSYLNMLLLPLAIVKRLTENLFGKKLGSDMTIPPKIINTIFTKILSFESILLKYFRLPFGLSVITIVKKSK